jgi:hypothetical protein
VAQERKHAPASDLYADWLAMLDAYQVKFLIVDAERDRGLFRAAHSHPQWAVDCRDHSSVLLVRVGPTNRRSSAS